jgi:hypothetical protein
MLATLSYLVLSLCRTPPLPLPSNIYSNRQHRNNDSPPSCLPPSSFPPPFPADLKRQESPGLRRLLGKPSLEFVLRHDLEGNLGRQGGRREGGRGGRERVWEEYFVKKGGE